MLSLRDVEAALEEALVRATDSREVATLTIAALGRRLVAEHKGIETRLEALEGRKPLVFAGAYDVAKTYCANDVVQRSGGLWVALIATTESPGQSAHWREIAKCR